MQQQQQPQHQLLQHLLQLQVQLLQLLLQRPQPHQQLQQQQQVRLQQQQQHYQEKVFMIVIYKKGLCYMCLPNAYFPIFALLYAQFIQLQYMISQREAYNDIVRMFRSSVQGKVKYV